MASGLPASNRSMRSDRNTYMGKKFVRVTNPCLVCMDKDILYHLNFGTKTHNLPAMFGDVKFVCVGGSPNRMKAFAHLMQKELGLEASGEDMKDICAGTDTACVKLVLCSPSVIGISEGIDSFGQDHHHTELDKELVEELFNCSKETPDFPTLTGHTMCTYDFYEGQGRLCSFSRENKLDYLKRTYKAGVRNTEMESTVFAAMCGLCGLKAAVVCVTLLDRLDSDQINLPRDVLVDTNNTLNFSSANSSNSGSPTRPFTLVAQVVLKS